MKKNQEGIGLFTCITIIVGSMIGSAIFSLSGLTMYQAGPAAVLSWIIAAAVMLVYGLCCAELSTVYPQSGGVYVFPSKAFKSPLLGWFSTWGFINSNIAAVAFSAIYVGTYLGAGFSLPEGTQVPLALISVAVCLVLNLIDFRVAGKLNSVLVSALVAAVAVYCAAALFGGSWNPSLFRPFFTQGAQGRFGFAAAVPTAMVGYGSIVSVAFMVSEVRSPSKNVPRAVLIAMAIVAAVYSLIIISTLGLVTAGFLADNPGMRYIPLYAACFTKLASIPWLAKVVSVAAVLALLTTMLMVLAITARAVRAAASDGLLPKVLASSNRSGVPASASVGLAVISAGIACFPSLTQYIVGLGALFGAVTIVINIFALYKTRTSVDSAGKNIFRAPGGQWLPALALLILVVCYIPDIISGGWQIWVYSALWYAMGLLVYRFSAAGRKSKQVRP